METDPTTQIVKNTETATDRTYPDFMETAERVAYADQNEVAEYKRAITADLDVNNLVNAMGEESTIFQLGDRLVPMLKMRLQNGAPIYISINEAGSNYRHLDALVGKSVKIAVTTFDKTGTFDENERPEYIALGSIRQAEFTIGGILYSEYQKALEGIEENRTDVKEENNSNPIQSSFTDEIREGVVSEVIDTPRLQMIFIDYRGMAIPMYANQFAYMTYTQPLSNLVNIGDNIRFKISSITKINYEDMDSVKEDIANHRQTPKGLRYLIRTTSLPFRENPEGRVKRLQKSQSSFIAHVVRYDPIRGILVEIAPGWWIKGVLPASSNYKPSINDEIAHTPVTVRINNLDYTTRRGRCSILAFPRGVAKSANQRF